MEHNSFTCIQRLFPGATRIQLGPTRKNVQLKTHNRITITQVGFCKVKIEQNNKCKICNFFVVQGYE